MPPKKKGTKETTTTTQPKRQYIKKKLKEQLDSIKNSEDPTPPSESVPIPQSDVPTPSNIIDHPSKEENIPTHSENVPTPSENVPLEEYYIIDSVEDSDIEIDISKLYEKKFLYDDYNLAAKKIFNYMINVNNINYAFLTNFKIKKNNGDEFKFYGEREKLIPSYDIEELKYNIYFKNIVYEI